jgi:lysophospholipase L1-like esterase
MGWAWCSPEVALIGILRVVEELRIQKPGSIIVINGLLPRSFDRKDGYLHEKRNNNNNIIGIHRKYDGRYNFPSLWNDIKNINQQLEEYSKRHDNVEYFDATDIFLMGDIDIVSEDDLRIDPNLMNDFLHPSHIGYKLWGDQIVLKLQELIHN